MQTSGSEEFTEESLMSSAESSSRQRERELEVITRMNKRQAREAATDDGSLNPSDHWWVEVYATEREIDEQRIKYAKETYQRKSDQLAGALDNIKQKLEDFRAAVNSVRIESLIDDVVDSEQELFDIVTQSSMLKSEKLDFVQLEIRAKRKDRVSSCSQLQFEVFTEIEHLMGELGPILLDYIREKTAIKVPYSEFHKGLF